MTTAEAIAWGAYNAVEGTDMSFEQWRMSLLPGATDPSTVLAIVTLDGTLSPDTPMTLDSSGAGGPTAIVSAEGQWTP